MPAGEWTKGTRALYQRFVNIDGRKMGVVSLCGLALVLSGLPLEGGPWENLSFVGTLLCVIFLFWAFRSPRMRKLTAWTLSDRLRKEMRHSDLHLRDRVTALSYNFLSSGTAIGFLALVLTRNDNVISSVKWQTLLFGAWIILVQLPFFVATWFAHSRVEGKENRAVMAPASGGSQPAA